MRELIIIRGGGDLASGVIQKFHRSGFDVLVLERKNPTFIRRKVSFGSAVYEGSFLLEGSESIFIGDIEELKNLSLNLEERERAEKRFFSSIEQSLSEEKIPIILDPEMKILEILRERKLKGKNLKEDKLDEKNFNEKDFKNKGLGSRKSLENFEVKALIDAVLAKKNLGMKKDLAPITIALGPGFRAEADADIVIETMRGHDLGRLIFQGEALPNTGVPGLVGGESLLRVIYSEHEGVIEIIKDIGDIVEAGEVIAKIGTETVKATITGLLRGMITPGSRVKKGMKIADIDTRVEERGSCFTISDKARALGGASLEAYLILAEKNLFSKKTY